MRWLSRPSRTACASGFRACRRSCCRGARVYGRNEHAAGGAARTQAHSTALEQPRGGTLYAAVARFRSKHPNGLCELAESQFSGMFKSAALEEHAVRVLVYVLGRYVISTPGYVCVCVCAFSLRNSSKHPFTHPSILVVQPAQPVRFRCVM